MKNTFFLLALSLLTLTCASPKKYLDKGDYDKAYKTALKSLENKKNVGENKRVLITALEKITERDYGRISEWNASEDEKDWDRALQSIDELKQKMEESGGYTNNHFEKRYAALEQKEAEIKASLFVFYKNRGLDQLEKFYETEKKLHAQYAHQDLLKADGYAVGDAGLDSLLQDAFAHAVVNIYVEADVLFELMQEWEVDRRFENIEDFSHRYLRVVYEENMKDVDCEMEIEFRSIDWSEREDNERRDFKQRVVVEYKTVEDTSGKKQEVPVYGDVEGEVNTRTITRTAVWEVNVNINPRTKNCQWSWASFRAERSSSIREVRTSGDERAIPAEYLNWQREAFEDEDDTIDFLLEELYGQITNHYF